MLLEATVHRIGGHPQYDDAPRKFGPVSFETTTKGVDSREIPSASSRDWMRIGFGLWVPVDDDWISCQVQLSLIDGQPVGARPALLFRRPYDVPTYTLFQPRWADLGVFSLGLRSLNAS
jgi:hypothetical protein